nr:MAG: V3 protein [Grapevine red blotch virus]
MELFFNRPRCLLWRVYDQVSELGLYDGGEDVDIPIVGDDEDDEMVTTEYGEFVKTLKRRRSERGEVTKSYKRRIALTEPDGRRTEVEELKDYLLEEDYDKHRRRLDLELGSGLHSPDSRCTVM